MSPEKRTPLFQWLAFGLTFLIAITGAILTFGDVRADVQRASEVNRAQWEQIREIKRDTELRTNQIMQRLNTIQFNQRRDMEDRGVRYIEAEQ